MRVTVNVYAFIRHYLPDAQKLLKDKEWDMPGNATVSDVLRKLGLPQELHVAVLLNNSIVDQKTTLCEGDIIHIIPQMSGG